MRDLDEEWPLLAALAEKLEERPVLVTFNGKSFDWPLLETRYRMTRTIALPELRAHLDLLHPARNLWRLRLGSVRLAELERQVLGWDRGADVMSDLIPNIYLDFVRGGSPEPLIPVIRHNQMDLRGLAALSCRVLSLLTDSDAGGHDALELYGVSRMCERRGELKRARELYERSIAASLPSETDRTARTRLAQLAKREGDFIVACKLWETALGSSKEGLEAYEQLAIYYEHHAKEPQRAFEITRQALTELRSSHRLGTIAANTYRADKARFEHRLARLERKTRVALLGGLELRH
jgi:tetratricopeptide (TPR) repeat protein